MSNLNNSPGRLFAVKETSKYKGVLIVVWGVLLGFVLARLTMVSTFAVIAFLSCVAVVVLTVFLRKVNYLIFSWFVLTSLLTLYLPRFVPLNYYLLVGRGIFWGLLACILAAWALENITVHKNFTHFDNTIVKALTLAFLIWCTLSLMTSLNTYNSIKKLSHLVTAFAVSYMFYDLFCRDEKNIKIMLRIVSLIVIFLSLAVNAIAVDSLLRGASIYKSINLWFYNPNILGTLLFVCSPLLITSGFDFKPVKRFKVFFVFMMVLAIFFAFHRTSWLALMVSIVFLLAKGRKRPLVVALTMIVLFVGGVTFPLWQQNVYGVISSEQFSGRKEIWQAAWRVAGDYPVLGVGLGNRGPMDEYITTAWLENQQTHSMYLQNAVEIGFVSVVIMLIFYCTLIYSFSVIEKGLNSPYLKLAVRGTTATFLGIFVHGIFNNNLSLLTSFTAGEFSVTYPYILLALPFAAQRLDEKKTSSNA